MLSEIVRAAAGFAGAMLIVAVLGTVMGRLMPRIKDGLPSDSLIVEALNGVTTFAPLLAFLAALLLVLGGAALKNTQGVR